MEGVLDVRREGGTLVLLGATQRYELSAGTWKSRPQPESSLSRYKPGPVPAPGLPEVQLRAPSYRVERYSVSVEAPDQPGRRFLVWNGGISGTAEGGDLRSGVYEILKGSARFFPLPQPDWETFRKLRPARVRDGYTEDSLFSEDIGPFQAVADRIWFGLSFYDGEGTTGIGGLGWFDAVSREFHVRYIPEIADWSVSALLADQREIWLGLVTHPEGADISGGLAEVRLSDWSVTVHKLPQIVRIIRRVNGVLYLGTSDGAYRLGPNGLDRIALRRTLEGGYRLETVR